MIPDVVDDGGFLVMSGKHWKFPRKNVLNVQTAEKPLVRVHETLYKTDICSVWLISGKFTWPCTTPSWGTGNDTVLGQPWVGLFGGLICIQRPVADIKMLGFHVGKVRQKPCNS